MIALAILTVSLLILVGTQSSAARMSAQADRVLIGTMLAKQKLADVEIYLNEEPGFSEQDEIVEDGDFEELFPGQYTEYRWRSVIRKLDLRGASTGGLSDLLSMGEEQDASSSAPGAPEQPDLASFINMDEVSEQLARFIREVRVVVYWEYEDGGDDVTITSHVIKPTGPAFVPVDALEQQAGGAQGGQ